MLRKFYEESFTSLFLPGNDVNIWVSDGFNGVYYLYTSTVTNTELSEESFDHQWGWFYFCELFMGIIQASFNAHFEAPSFKNYKLW